MSATHITLQFSAVVDDYDRQPEEIRAECERTGQSVDDLVRHRLEAVMSAAGQKLIDEHPEWFRYGTGLV